LAQSGCTSPEEDKHVPRYYRGIDWSETGQDYAVLDDKGTVVAEGQVEGMNLSRRSPRLAAITRTARRSRWPLGICTPAAMSA
jgi:hypothetical protein